jgi:NitT/TauT family transport system substrate-binding protein
MKNKLQLRSIHGRLGVTLMAAIFVCASSIAYAETNLVRVGTQFGLAYLPLVVMEHDHLWEKQADARGVKLRVEYARLGGGAGLNDALLSDSVELVAGGLAPMLLLWDRTSSTDKVTGIAALNVSPMYILTNKPGVKSLADFAAEDRIAVPAIKVSIQAIALEAAAEKAFGPGQGHRLDTLTVTMQHPDALIALMAHSSQITAYVSSSPFQEIALKTPGISKVTDSFAAFGGPATFSVVYAKKRFGTDNPVVMAAFYAALREAVALIASQRGTAIDEYLEVTREKTDRAVIEEILTRPDFKFGIEPVGTLPVANLMHHFGLLRQTPTSWKDYFADPLHSGQGS